MAATTAQDPKNLNHPPPPYSISVGTSRSGNAFTENWGRSRPVPSQRISNGGGGIKDDTKFLTLMHVGGIIILVLCALSNMIALHRNSKIMEQNLDLMARQLRLFGQYKTYTATVTKNDNARFKRMLIPMDTCPPCPTEAPPTPIEPHRNPVSVLNEEVGQKANYTLEYLCEDPHMHKATLRILDDHFFEGKLWTGKGKDRKGAKQAAAWDAITKDLPELKEEVAAEYIPPLYDPHCNKPHTNEV